MVDLKATERKGLTIIELNIEGKLIRCIGEYSGFAGSLVEVNGIYKFDAEKVESILKKLKILESFKQATDEEILKNLFPRFYHNQNFSLEEDEED